MLDVVHALREVPFFFSRLDAQWLTRHDGTTIRRSRDAVEVAPTQRLDAASASRTARDPRNAGICVPSGSPTASRAR